MYDGQLEMSFAGVRGGSSARQRRLTRAQWWFQRMRQAVDGALDWQPAPPPRPEQTWLPGTHRAAGGVPQVEPESTRLAA
jgi:hypothetical protein